MIERAECLADQGSLDYHPERSMSKSGNTMTGSHPRVSATRTRRVGVPEVEIRPALREHLLRHHAHEADTVLIEELGLGRGKVRVDLAVVNGSLHGFEIKSDRDSLRRLAVQVDLYSQVLDRATLVVGERFAARATSLVPMWWGVVRVSSKPSGLRFSTLRRAKLNPQRNARVLAELIWSDQALALLEERGAARGMKGKPRRHLWDRICECLTVDEIAAAVRNRLKATSDSEVPA